MVDFLVIGLFNVVSYSSVFPLIKEMEVCLGYNRVGEFCDSKFCNTIWFTTLSVDRQPFLELAKTYNDEDYKEYDHFKAINVNRTVDIPCDYYDAMGVPITFLEKWNPEQFQILDASDYRKDDRFNNMKIQMLCGSGGHLCDIDGKPHYARILIRRKI